MVFTGGISLNVNIMSTTIPLSAIGNDDGNMAVAGYVGHIDNSINVTSLDYIPNAGNGIVGANPLGDLPWLSLLPKDGSLFTGESDTVIKPTQTDFIH